MLPNKFGTPESGGSEALLSSQPETTTPSVPSRELSGVTTDSELGGRRVVVGLAIALVAVIAAFGAILGYALPAQTGIEEITVLGIPIPISPISLALYGSVTVGIFLVTFLFVVQVISRFDDDAVSHDWE